MVPKEETEMSIRAKNLKLGYGEKVVINDLTMHVPEGSFCSVIGPNGCGKSTLLKAVSGSLKPAGGEIEIKGETLSGYAPRVLAKIMTFLTQGLNVPDQFSVREMVSYGRFPYTNWMGTLSSRDREAVDHAMELAEITEYADTELSHLSGGERQRVRIAMALAQEAEILLLDEPTTYLDISHQFQTLELIRRLHREMGRTILMVLHDLNQAARYSDYIFVIKNGELCSQGSSDKILTPELLRDVFSIEARVIRDEENDCPFFMSPRSIEKS